MTNTEDLIPHEIIISVDQRCGIRFDDLHRKWRTAAAEAIAERLDKIIYDTLMRQEQPKSNGRVDV